MWRKRSVTPQACMQWQLGGKLGPLPTTSGAIEEQAPPSTVDGVTYTTALPPRGPRTMPAQSCGKTRGHETVCGAVGYQISLSASDSSGSAGSTLRRVAASHGWKVGSGAANSWLGREAADPIVIPYLCLLKTPEGRAGVEICVS
jgi:hypothetical protein